VHYLRWTYRRERRNAGTWVADFSSEVGSAGAAVVFCYKLGMTCRLLVQPLMHSSADACYAHFHGEETADGVTDCRGFVLVEDSAHDLSRTNLEPINVDLQELSEALALTTLGFDIPSLVAN